MDRGGRSLLLIDLHSKEVLAGAAAYIRSIGIASMSRGVKPCEEMLGIRSLNNVWAARASKGKAAYLGFKLTRVARVVFFG